MRLTTTSHRPPRQRPDHRHRRHPVAVLMSLLLSLVVLAAACSSSDVGDAVEASSDAAAYDGDFATGAAEPPMAYDEAADDAMFEVEGESRVMGDSGTADSDSADSSGGDGALTGSAGAPPAQALPDLGRDIIYTADLELGATDVSSATREAIRTVEGLGGFLFAQETVGGSGGRSVLVFKILPEQFQRALAELGSVGTVRSQSISADDVTAIVVDLESRISTAEASVIRLRNLLDGADEIDVIASLENQLLQRETTLEQLRGQLRSVRNQVDLATINVTVHELLNRPGLTLGLAAYEGHDAGFNCLDAGRIARVEQEAAVTLCYTLTNVGDTDLVDLAITDPELGASLGDLIVVEGSATSLAPGASVVLAHEVELDAAVRLRSSASAIGLDADGNRLDEVVEATAPRLRVDVLVDDDGLPGFGDVLAGSWRVLATIGVLVALAAVAAAPFLLVALVLAPIVWFVLRRIRRTSSQVSAEGPDEQFVPADAPQAPSPSSVS